MTMGDDPTGLKGYRDHPLIPQWCIDRAKRMAVAAGDDGYWLNYLNIVAFENRMMYGESFPAKDPEKEARRQKATKHQRVISPERFYK